ncbi:TetR/AcrR family transcriptional regulator [Pararhodobacter zhoushanensis]|uniref:TetR/AcrR family transcriptional regulator n=1 Tax=Pararhodobacter zhoushanensis TaxID=2479545 RepID=UPI001FE7CABA|nr:TetR/AcrR family transcriptional regulator [Pararhodobacter zhoushanensis]
MDTAATSPDSLRDRLIEAGLALLIEDGPDGLTLRRAAARAGVSHAAPAHHFKGLSGLRTAIAARAFAIFAEAMLTRLAEAPDRPFARLLAISDGYLDFAKSRSGLFHIMFGCPDLDTTDPDLVRESDRAYGTLRIGCLPFSGGVPDPVLEGLVWSSVHGYATLGFNDPTRRVNDAVLPFEAMLAQIVPRDGDERLPDAASQATNPLPAGRTPR